MMVPSRSVEGVPERRESTRWACRFRYAKRQSGSRAKMHSPRRSSKSSGWMALSNRLSLARKPLQTKTMAPPLPSSHFLFLAADGAGGGDHRPGSLHPRGYVRSVERSINFFVSLNDAD